MAAILIVLGFVAMGIGLFSITNATLGVGMMGIACFLAILARIAQANSHQKEMGLILASMVNELKDKQGE